MGTVHWNVLLPFGGFMGKLGWPLFISPSTTVTPFLFFSLKQFFVLLVVVVVCALNLIQRAGTGDEHFSFKTLRKGGGQRAQLK